MARKKDTPCAGCGELIWAGSKTCRACRFGDLEHGSARMYRDHGCRCDACRAGNAERQRMTAAAFRQRNGYSMYAKHRKPTTARHGNAVPRAVRLEIYERDGWICQLCDGPVDRDLDPNDRMAATLDHIECQSWALIPDHSTENLRLAHRACNSRRKNLAA